MAASARGLGRTEPPLEVCKLDEESACLGLSLAADWLSDLGFWGSDPLSKMGTCTGLQNAIIPVASNLAH